MFTYCLNNPPKHKDHAGTDAIVLFDDDSMGHIGIMVQDKDGVWWHYYWGTEGGKEGSFNRVRCIFDMDVEPYSWHVKFTGDVSSLDSINASNQYSGDYEVKHYFKGDFSTAIDGMQNNSEDYNLYSNNCSQVSLRILASANKDYSRLFEEAAQFTRPKKASQFISENRYALSTVNMRLRSTYIAQRIGII